MMTSHTTPICAINCTLYLIIIIMVSFQLELLSGFVTAKTTFNIAYSFLTASSIIILQGFLNSTTPSRGFYLGSCTIRSGLAPNRVLATDTTKPGLLVLLVRIASLFSGTLFLSKIPPGSGNITIKCWQNSQKKSYN